MHGVSHGEAEVAVLLRAAFVHRSDFLLEAFAGEPETRFKRRDEFRTELFGEREQIAHVVGVRMREKNRVKPCELFQRLGAVRIGHDPRIDERDLAGRSSERKSAVAEIGDAVAFEIVHEKPFESELFT